MSEAIERRAERREQRRERREQRRRIRLSGIEHYTLSPFEVKPVIAFHASLLIGVWEPYIYPSLVPLMLIMTRIARTSPGLEAHARDAFNLTWLYSMAFCAITCVTLIAGISDGVTDITTWHYPLVGAYIFLILRAIVELRKDGSHHYPLPVRMLRANGEASFMGRD